MKVKEGKISFEIPDKLTVTRKDEVFYNPKMETCRDIAVAIIEGFLKLYCNNKIAYIADALAGTGVRGLRYAKEVDYNVKVYLNDINPKAYEKIKENAKLNGIDNIEIFNEDANIFLAKHYRFFNVVDIDPFGSPSPYIDQAIRSLITKNGLLCLTATDTAALCGRAKRACLRKYLAYPLLGKDCHEFALRILVGYAMRLATRYNLLLTPVFAHATDHYVRVYLKTDRGAKRADKAFEMLGYVKDINGIKIVKAFSEGYEKGYSGPLYIGNLYDGKLVEKAINIAKNKGFKERVIKILMRIRDESEISQIGCYDTHLIAKILKVSVPPMEYIVNSLKDLGYKAAITHYNPKGIKTNANIKTLMEVLLEYKMRG
ncbi:N(2),N(2)-dimethylguanosine tRNA methyltransferase [Methanocaldococcus villosus KIN24-T80]|uniref:tRNA (guanine(26)-N(2))-dimethyltransferase n=1 Tax=Methanocaldococcus villosus KIN24-T80 TaxID=1069083 RepID=N6UV14_9EURY|nr:tRNA (guanine(10)-N(2))-dimethyltransferase [Methanocaldococcus villosus]ENN96204.1 N(2),N(2)-dimethylguanosine tRNA methyltransferase [Methanocaldococcus villosus KIN24-T80]